MPDTIHYRLAQKATGNALDGKDGTAVYMQPPNGGDYQKWSIDSDGEYFKLVQKATGNALDGKDGTVVYMQPPNGGDYQKWKIVPSDIKWKITFVGIEYKSSEKPVTKPDLIHSDTIENLSSATVTRRVSMSCKKTSTFEWSFQKTFGVEVSTSFEANVPFGSLTGSVSLNVELSKTETISKTQETTYEINSEVQIPPNSSVLINGYVDWAESVKTPYTLKLRVSATNNNQLVDIDQLKQLMKLTNCTADIVDELKDSKELIVSISGYFAGSFGLDTNLKVEPIKSKSTLL